MPLDRHRTATAPGTLRWIALRFAFGPAAYASSLVTGGGPGFTHGAGDEITRTGHASVAGGPAGAIGTVAGARYDDSTAGPGAPS